MGRLLSRATRRTQSQIRYVAAVRKESARDPVKRVYDQVERDFGMLAPPVSLHSPAPEPMAAGWLMLRETLLAGGLVPRAAKEAVAVAVSLGNSCPYCVDVHSTLLHGLVRSKEAAAVAEGHGAPAADRELARLAAWARSGGAPGGGAAAVPAPAPEVPELVGTAVTFHYLNRMVNVFLVESPLPPGLPAAVRRTIRRVAGSLLRPVLSRTVEPGAALGLLPAAPLPADLRWAAGNPTVAGAFGRAADSIDAAGGRSVPPAVRELVAAELADRDGLPPAGSSGGWVHDRVAGLPEAQRPAGRLALLTALASYQVGPSAVEEYRRYRSDDQSLIELTAWASMAAARWWGVRLWRGQAAGAT